MPRAIIVLVAGLISLPVASATLSDQEPSTSKRSSDPFVGAITASPGCLGVQTAKTQNGRDLIFAWFKNKRAVLAWYHSESHQQIVTKYFGDQELRKPLDHILNENQPILVLVSATRSDKPIKPFTAFSQLSIELYQPLSGGFFVGGRFSPKSLEVPGFRDLSPKGL